jgi:hypothetical protein
VPEPDGIPNPYGGWAGHRGEGVELESYANQITKGARSFVIPPGPLRSLLMQVSITDSKDCQGVFGAL